MTLREAVQKIESQEFAISMNVASGVGTFFNNLSKDRNVSEVLKAMVESGEAREEILGRLQEMSQMETDRRYEHPKDTALAAFLWLTLFAAPDYSQIAADLVDRAPQCWYAKKLARKVLLPAKSTTADFPESPPRRYTSGDNVITINPVTRSTKRFYQQRAEVSADTVA